MDADLTTTERRRFNIGDTMLIVVALAIGLALARTAISMLGKYLSMVVSSDSPTWMRSWPVISGELLNLFGVVFCFIVPLVPALIVARLRRPRPPLRRMAFQPGFVALSAVALIGIVDVDVTYLDLVSFPPLVHALLPGGAVLVSWLLLVAFRRWQPEPSWIDRAGRVVGIFWMATIPWWIWIIVF